MRILLIIITFLMIFSLNSFAANGVLDDSIDIPGKFSNATIYERHNIRFSGQGNLLYPSNSGGNLDNGYSLGSTGELAFKVDDSIDQFINGGIVLNKRVLTSVGTDAAYSLIKAGYGMRLYLLEWVDLLDVTGVVNLYAVGGVDYYIATRTTDTAGTSPSELTGPAAYIGTGLEIIFSPYTTAFFEANYMRTSLKVDKFELPLDGLSFNGGVRVNLI